MTSTPPTLTVVLIAGAEAGRNRRVGSEGALVAVSRATAGGIGSSQGL